METRACGCRACSGVWHVGPVWIFEEGVEEYDLRTKRQCLKTLIGVYAVVMVMSIY